MISPVSTITPHPIQFGSTTLTLDPSGVVWWQAQRTLLVADLHLDKGASFARRGILLPPYDTRATLERLDSVLDRLRPDRVIALGDSFHDAAASSLLDPADRVRLNALVARQDWVWVTGNHDPNAEGVAELNLDGIALRHEAVAGASFEISGHYHPKARLSVHGRMVARPCFMASTARLILPAFGAYTGGLDVTDPVYEPLFPEGFIAYLTGSTRLTRVPSVLLARPRVAEPVLL
jgi:DNA ligase-associated metallophosphoesterase